MRILVVVPALSSYLFLRELCSELVERGNEVHLATSWLSLGQFESDGSRIHFHAIEFPRGMNPIAHLKASRKLNEIVKLIEPDVVDVHFSAAAFTAALARNSAWPVVIATVQGLRFPLATGFGALMLKWAECWSASRLNRYVVLTNDDYQAMEAAGVKNCFQQKAFGFGCDLKKFNRAMFTDQDMAKTEQDIGKQPNEVVFTFIGRLVAFKGFHLVVKSFLEANSTESNIKLLVCGEFDRYHDSGLESHEISAFEGHVNVVNIGWTDTVEKYLSISDVVVFPSEREGVPVNLMEALSMGVPVITCDSRGCREVMNQGANGIVLKERNTEALTEAMIVLAKSPELRNKYSEAAIAFRENFDRFHFVSEHIEVIHESVVRG